jgi:hypothetical protein
MSEPLEPLLYLIGVNHAVQFKSVVSHIFGESGSVYKKREAFKAHVAEVINGLNLEILAEEFNDEAKRESEARELAKTFAEKSHEPFEWQTARQQFDWETELQKFARTKGIEHRFCDPQSSEKEALGIEVDPRKEREADRRKREQVWLSRIADCKGRRVLFVCGDDHYELFAQLLEQNGFNLRRGAHYSISDEEFHSRDVG